MTLEVIEIIGRSEQGFTKPYICRCDDGEVYFVKGRSATRRGLINEWLCANLAEAFGLPIAPFAVAEVPQELIEADLTGWLKDLGAGAVFASRKVMGQELAASQVFNIPSDLRRDVLVFDWWVRNNDRNLTAKGGNVNLLWQPSQLVRDDDYQRAAEGSVAVIDLCQAHVFAGDLADTFSDFLLREAFSQRLRQALDVFEGAWDNLPLAWGFVDGEQTMSSDYPKAEVQAMLNLIESPAFWNLPL
jgi:hypothetical protein